MQSRCKSSEVLTSMNRPELKNHLKQPNLTNFFLPFLTQRFVLVLNQANPLSCHLFCIKCRLRRSYTWEWGVSHVGHDLEPDR